MSTETYVKNSNSWIQRLLRCHWMLGVLALAEIILGFVLLAFPFLVGVGAVLIASVAFMLMGGMRLLAAIRTPKHRLWQILSSIVYIALGVAMMLSPLKIMELLTLIAGAFLILMGLIRAVIATISRRRRSRVWLYLHALVSFMLGLIVCGTWPESSLWFFGAMIAIEMIFSGWTMLFLSLVDDDVEED